MTALTPFARPPSETETGDEYVDRGRAARRRCVQTQHKTRTRHTQRQTTALLLFCVFVDSYTFMATSPRPGKIAGPVSASFHGSCAFYRRSSSRLR